MTAASASVLPAGSPDRLMCPSISEARSGCKAPASLSAPAINARSNPVACSMNLLAASNVASWRFAIFLPPLLALFMSWGMRRLPDCACWPTHRRKCWATTTAAHVKRRTCCTLAVARAESVWAKFAGDEKARAPWLAYMAHCISANWCRRALSPSDSLMPTLTSALAKSESAVGFQLSAVSVDEVSASCANISSSRPSNMEYAFAIFESACASKSCAGSVLTTPANAVKSALSISPMRW
mmetsp:Transcript_36054/g.58105  ORF Transcript_36054/g.58105 Transcript_36054/m.58105 type:complete len:240 (-) Transcript_36054:575-1294(-)